MAATKAADTKIKKRFSSLEAWVKKHFEESRESDLTSVGLAEIASKALGENVSPSRLVVILDRLNIDFARTASDPVKASRTRIDLLTNRVRALEERLDQYERKKRKKATSSSSSRA